MTPQSTIMINLLIERMPGFLTQDMFASSSANVLRCSWEDHRIEVPITEPDKNHLTAWITKIEANFFLAFAASLVK